MQEQAIRWERADSSRIPFAVYTGPNSHKKELERFFYQGHWSMWAWRQRSPSPATSSERSSASDRSS